MHDPDDHLIVPGERIGPFRLGEPADPQRARLVDPELEDRGSVRVVSTRDLSLFIEDGRVTQVGVHGEHPARTADGLRLGMVLRDVPGSLVVDASDRVLLVFGVPGLCFETERGLDHVDESAWEDGESITLPATDRITWIGVYPQDEEDTLSLLDVELA